MSPKIGTTISLWKITIPLSHTAIGFELLPKEKQENLIPFDFVY